MMTLPPVSKMAPDTRKRWYDRAAEIAAVAAALKMAKSPPPTPETGDEDGERRLAIEEAIYDAVFSCTHNDVVARAVYAAKRDGGWGAHFVVGAAAEREKLNKTRAANAKRYGVCYEV